MLVDSTDHPSPNPKWSYQYESTAAYGGTTFMRLSNKWMKENHSNHWSGGRKRMKILVNYLLTFLFICLIETSCSFKTKCRGISINEVHTTTKHASMRFSSLATFSKNKTSALKNYRKFNISRSIKKSIKLSNWAENMEYPPDVFICENGYYFLLSVTKNPTGLDTNFYHWIVLNNDGRVVDEFVSLSKNINNCYMEKGKLHMVVYDYDDEFFLKEQSELIPIIIRDFIVEDSLALSKESKFYVEEG